MKKFKLNLHLVLALVLMLSLALSACTPAAGGAAKSDGAKVPGTEFVLATGGTSGTYYPLGGALANIWNSKIEGMNVTAQSTGASMENCRLVNSNEAQLAIVQNDVADYAFNGTDLFDGEKLGNIMGIASLYPEYVQIAARKDSGITSVADLKDKKVSVGDAGSGVEFNAKQILEAYGLSFDDIKKNNLSFKESANGMANGTLDACFVSAGVPNAALMEYAVSNDIVMIPVGDAEAKALVEKYPFYTISSISKDSYKGMTEDVQALAIKAVLIVNKDMDEETVYQMTKAMFENQKDFAQAHAKGADLSLETAVQGISIPYHPGALKYYAEVKQAVPAQ